MHSPPKFLLPLLWPLSLIYGAVVVARAWLYKRGILKQKRLNGVVISVGNLTVGGTGKTPVVVWLLDRLVADGQRPALLTRGYKSTPMYSSSPDSLPLGLHRMGDEIWPIFQRFGDRIAYGIGADRAERGRELQTGGVQVFVLDDGFQHLRLTRNLNIALIDASNCFGNGMLLPAGSLREPKSALSRADAVLITRSRHAPALEAIVARYTKAPVYYAWPELECVLEGPGQLVPADAAWKEAPVLAFCGIGNPEGFFSDIRQWHPKVVAQKAFPDHHQYTPRDWHGLKKAAKEAGATAFVCTEKDHYNLAFAFAGDPNSLCDAPRIFVPRIRMQVSDADGLWNHVQALLLKRETITP